VGGDAAAVAAAASTTVISPAVVAKNRAGRKERRPRAQGSGLKKEGRLFFSRPFSNPQSAIRNRQSAISICNRQSAVIYS
jgi:hypothetical protein